MIQTIINTIKATAPTGTFVTYDEAHMINNKLDLIDKDTPFVYVEEYRSGRYESTKYAQQKVTRVEVTFGRLTSLHNEATQREEIREYLDTNLIRPFVKAWTERMQAAGKEAPTYNFTAAWGRFDANEVSITLTFEVKEGIC